jgi:hypothetical protein
MIEGACAEYPQAAVDAVLSFLGPPTSGRS